MNWLERAEQASIALSALGTAVAVFTQQVAYATTPLVLALSLNVINRKQLRKENQDAIATITTNVNQQLAAIQPYQYQLVLDPPDSRAALLEALSQAQERVIIVSPWLRQPVFDELRSPIEAALSRGDRVDIGFGHEGNAMKLSAISLGRWWAVTTCCQPELTEDSGKRG
jgi:phosphatidylserine/phosphatidylglycerophosphate/cardiolipin synthase-like enzyme